VKKYKISKENIEKYLELSDKSADDQMQYANTLFFAKEYQPAVNKMQELISNGIEKPYMYRVIGFSLFELKDYKGAIENMDKLFAKQEPAKIIPLDYMYYGKLLLKDSVKAAQADSYFEKGIAADTSADKTPLYRELAEIYKDAPNYKAAAKWYKKTSETGSSSVDALDYWWSGVMYYYAKDYVNAEPMLTLMSQKYPEEPSSYYWLARNTIELKDKDYKNGAATPMFTKWLGMVKADDPAKKNDLVKAYTYIAMVAYNTKNKVEATTYCNKILALDAANKTAKDIKAALPSLK
jgi:tetratricopeptide (TPR) repeat protein